MPALSGLILIAFAFALFAVFAKSERHHRVSVSMSVGCPIEPIPIQTSIAVFEDEFAAAIAGHRADVRPLDEIGRGLHGELNRRLADATELECAATVAAADSRQLRCGRVGAHQSHSVSAASEVMDAERLVAGINKRILRQVVERSSHPASGVGDDDKGGAVGHGRQRGDLQVAVGDGDCPGHHELIILRARHSARAVNRQGGVGAQVQALGEVDFSRAGQSRRNDSTRERALADGANAIQDPAEEVESILVRSYGTAIQTKFSSAVGVIGRHQDDP